MQGEGVDPLDQEVSPPRFAGQHGRSRDLLARAEARLRASAARLQVSDLPGQARRAKQFADRVRLGLDHPHAARLLDRMVRGPGLLLVPGTLPDMVLDVGLELMRAERGNVQLADPATGTLRIAAQRGFGSDFLDYFAVVADDGSACGRAARRSAQVVIADVYTDPGFAPHRDIASASGFRAVVSTPLIDGSGSLVGMVSTHYPRPISLPDSELQIMARIGSLIGAWLDPQLEAAQPAPSR